MGPTPAINDAAVERSDGPVHQEERDRERRFREMMDALPAAIYTTDAQGRLVYFNPACVAFSGRTPELGTNQWCVAWKLFHPDGRPMPHEEHPLAIASRKAPTCAGPRRRRATRRYAHLVHLHPTPLFDAAGTVVGGINMLVDITERKETEAVDANALARLNELKRAWNMRSLRDGLDEILAATIELLGADFGSIQLLDENRGALTIAARSGLQHDSLDSVREVQSTPLLGRNGRHWA